ncbi:histone-like nucleoid-structuring protein Lsr2 [Glycomyces sp. MUSA5-2]|uniref:histone-like nucleoid-structuring protein Lsr2 n=1 Tax=Glycomyces sp. MUSA5-2 TaxID=2053002 RepID=UPI003009D9B3
MRHIETILIDDFDGTSGATPVRFALDDRVYTVDLSPKHEDDLRRLLAPYTEAGTREGRLRIAGRTTKSTAGERQPRANAGHNAQIRAWAQRNGMAIAEHGRIPGAVKAAYQQALAEHQTRRSGLAAARQTTAAAGTADPVLNPAVPAP